MKQVSFGVWGLEIFPNGIIDARFHEEGEIPVESERLINSERGERSEGNARLRMVDETMSASIPFELLLSAMLLMFSGRLR